LLGKELVIAAPVKDSTSYGEFFHAAVGGNDALGFDTPEHAGLRIVYQGLRKLGIREKSLNFRGIGEKTCTLNRASNFSFFIKKKDRGSIPCGIKGSSGTRRACTHNDDIVRGFWNHERVFLLFIFASAIY
jgi:hypothetical protein